MNVKLLGANNPALVGETVHNLLAAGYSVLVEGEHIACAECKCDGTLLARITYTKPVNEEKRAARRAAEAARKKRLEHD